jgi:predicted nucleic acid-binding Zn ribbon protein
MQESLIKCHVCGKEIAQTANKCPHCGGITVRTKKIKMGFFIATIVVILMLIISGIMAH